MKLLSLFGIDRRVRRLRIAAAEGAIAAEDRVQLARLAWESEKQRFKLMLMLVMAVLGLTTVTIALLSVAVVVHFWDTPNRITAAWSVAALWVVLWIAAVVALVNTLNAAKDAFAPTRRELQLDWAWARHRFGAGRAGRDPGGEGDGESDEEGVLHTSRTATQEELLARIAVQRQRIATLETPAPPSPHVDETPSETALRLAKTHPVAAGVAAAAVVAVLGPRRLLRWTAVIAPVLWRMRG